MYPWEGAHAAASATDAYKGKPRSDEDNTKVHWQFQSQTMK